MAPSTGIDFSTERAYFDGLLEELLEKHEGKYAVIIGEILLGICDTLDEALELGLDRCKGPSFYSPKIMRGTPFTVLPSFVLPMDHMSAVEQHLIFDRLLLVLEEQITENEKQFLIACSRAILKNFNAEEHLQLHVGREALMKEQEDAQLRDSNAR